MGKSSSGEYRQFYLHFWRSSFVDQMDPVEKLIYVYMITSPDSNMEGLYKTTMRRIAFETGIEADTIRRLGARLEARGKGGFYEANDVVWVVVSEAPSHMSHSPTILKHAKDVYSDVPDEVLQYAFSVGYEVPKKLQSLEGIPYAYPMHTRPYKDEDEDEDKTKTETKRRTADATHEDTGLPMNSVLYRKLCWQYGQDTVDAYFIKIDDYIVNKSSKNYTDCARTARNWITKDNVPALPIEMRDVRFDPSRTGERRETGE